MNALPAGATAWVDDVSVRLGGTQALDAVTVTVAPGEVQAVVGGDGAGKSTLLRVVVGELAPTSGSVVAPGPQDIGYLPSGAGSWAELTVGQNMEFVGGAFGLRGAPLQERIGEMLERADLTAARDRVARQLSGGMRRKLGFCMAMIHDPALLVLDEPSTGVDPVSRVDLWRLISGAAAAGTAVLMTTTYLDEAERATGLLALDSGRAIIDCSPTDALDLLDGVIVATSAPVREQWSWRRGRDFHEYWPHPSDGEHVDAIDPDLEDIVVARTLVHRAERASAR